MSALGQQSSHRVLGVEDDVEVPLRRRRRTSLPGPLYPDVAVGLEGVDQTLLGDVPGDAPEEDLAAVERVLVLSGRELAGPGAGGVVQTGGTPVQLGGPVQTGGVAGRDEEEGVELLPVREEGGGSHLAHCQLAGLGRAAVQQRVEDVGRLTGRYLTKGLTILYLEWDKKSHLNFKSREDFCPEETQK